MTVLRGQRCDVCKKESYDYQPQGWKRLRLETSPLRGGSGFEYTERAEVCSDACALKWWWNQVRDLDHAMEGPDPDACNDEIREEQP